MILKTIKKLFVKKVANPSGIDEKKLQEMIRRDLPIEIIQKEFPTVPTESLIKYILFNRW